MATAGGAPKNKHREIDLTPWRPGCIVDDLGRAIPIQSIDPDIRVDGRRVVDVAEDVAVSIAWVMAGRG